MLVEMGNIFCRVAVGSDTEKSWLREYLSFEDERARFAARRYGGDGRVKMYNLLSDSFPTGLIPLVKKASAAEGTRVDIVDKRVKPCQRDPSANLAWLRDYQLAGVDKGIQVGRGIFWITTGGGKTEVAIGLAEALPCQWLFLVHRTTLMHQAADRYEQRTGKKAGRIGEGEWQIPPGCSFIVATFQTLHARHTDQNVVNLMTSTEGLICDESHTVAADTLWRVAMSAKNAYFRFGLSGTPLARGDKRSVLSIAALGPVIYRVKPEVLIAAGVLARPKIHLVQVKQKSERPTWQGVYGEAIVRSLVRNKVVVDCAKLADKPCLLFVKEIRHGKVLTEALNKSGVKADFVYGSDDTPARQAAVKRLIRGDTEVLVCSVIFQEGIDIPQLRSVVNASGGKSIIAALQRIGRGMRVSSGKSEFDVYEIADRGCGCPAKGGHTGCRWLERHTKMRVRAFTVEGYEATVFNSVA